MLDGLANLLRGVTVRHPHTHTIRWASPRQITFCYAGGALNRSIGGDGIEGDWDLNSTRFETSDIYTAIERVCVQRKRWEDTAFYQHALGEIMKGRVVWGCGHKEELDQNCRAVEDLCRSAQQQWSVTYQAELSATATNSSRADEEVTVAIGRYGDLLLCGGAFRVAIAKLYGVERIPVRVVARHRDWSQLRRELLAFARENTVGPNVELYQRLTHPDLQDLPATHACDNRFELIRRSMSVGQGQLLDIGANLGYFCHRFEDVGFDCWAVESHPLTACFLKRLARAENRRFKIVTESVLDAEAIRKRRFEVVLALNIFHHFLKKRHQFDKLVELLRCLRAAEIFFEPHLPEEPQMRTAYRNFFPAEFVEVVMNYTGLKDCRLIGRVKSGRLLYKLY